MAKKDTTSTMKYKADIAELKSGFQQAKTAIASAKVEFEKSVESLDNWRESSEGVEAKLTQLNKTLSEQKKQLNNYREQLLKTEEQFGKNSIQAEQLREKIEKQKSTINKTTGQIQKYNSELREVAEAEQRVAREGGTVREKLEEIRGGTNEAGDGFTVLKGTLADLASNAIQNIVSGLIDIGRELWSLPEATKEFRTVFNATMQSAEDSVIGLEGATKAYEEFYRVSADEGQSAEATSHIAGLVNNQKDLEGALNGVIGAWVEYGDSISIEGLAEASNETAKTGKITGQFADALNWAGESEEAFQKKLDECTTTQERQKLVVDTLNRLYGENAKAFEENNKSLLDTNSANLNLLQTQSELATAIEPVTALWTNMKAKALDAITPAIEWLSTKIQSLNKYLSEHEGVATALKAVLMGLAGAFLVLGTGMAIQSLLSMLPKLKTAFMALNTVMKANPILLVVSLIAGLVVAFMTLWNKSEAFRNFWINLWDNIKNVAQTVWNAISGFFSGAWDAIKNVWNGAKAFFSGIWNGIKAVFLGVVSFYANIFLGAYNAIKNAFSGIVGFFSGVWNKIKAIFSNVGTAIGGAITKAVSGAVNKVLSTAVRIINGFISAINTAIGVINKIPGVKIRKLSKLSVPAMATGGVVDGATLAMIGENGKEAVIPLEKNLGWIKGVASNIVDELKTSGSGGVVGMSGGVTNNYNFNQTNNSPKALSRLEIYRQTKNQMLQLKGVNA